MISAMINGEKRPPEKRGEVTACVGCGGTLRAVIPQFKVAHWRHDKGDCDTWSEPEGEWHRMWKKLFNPSYCEVFMRDEESQEAHRADVLCPRDEGRGVVLELQSSHLPEADRLAREAFYSKNNRMFWLLNMQRTRALAFNFETCLKFDETNKLIIADRAFYQMDWFMKGTMLDKWKQSQAHVFLNSGRYVYYLATMAACRTLVASQGKGEFALARLTILDFLKAVTGNNPSALAVTIPEQTT